MDFKRFITRPDPIDHKQGRERERKKYISSPFIPQEKKVKDENFGFESSFLFSLSQTVCVL